MNQEVAADCNGGGLLDSHFGCYMDSTTCMTNLVALIAKPNSATGLSVCSRAPPPFPLPPASPGDPWLPLLRLRLLYRALRSTHTPRLCLRGAVKFYGPS
eukprot:TRINITY_DN11960_c0_g1_i1.p1 TRINITY_DN11960_c0_g1~~TRINITY_DN11960_c0_g1_i1.p1  ORF type:complete len:100 (-),score=5.32 TRINITY_DN11960_c0_g1_i1:1082-1381(-)